MIATLPELQRCWFVGLFFSLLPLTVHICRSYSWLATLSFAKTACNVRRCQGRRGLSRERKHSSTHRRIFSSRGGESSLTAEFVGVKHESAKSVIEFFSHVGSRHWKAALLAPYVFLEWPNRAIICNYTSDKQAMASTHPVFSLRTLNTKSVRHSSLQLSLGWASFTMMLLLLPLYSQSSSFPWTLSLW